MARERAETRLTGANSGWKWSLLTDRRGIPIGWAADAANRNDLLLFTPTLETVGDRGLLCETLHLDRGYDCATVRSFCVANGLHDVVCAKRRADTRPGVRKRPRDRPPRVALASRAHQLVALELRSTSTQYRPQDCSPAYPVDPGDHPAHHRQAHRLAEPVVSHLSAYPLRLLASGARPQHLDVDDVRTSGFRDRAHLD